MPDAEYDAVVVGAGPNGLAAAITLARAGRRVLVIEANETLGGGARSEALTLPGFLHDVCSAIHPLGVGSPFFRSLPLAEHGLEWIYPPAGVAHPFDDGSAGLLERSVEATGATLAPDDGAYRRLMTPFASHWDQLQCLLSPLSPPLRPATLLRLARFGWLARRSATGLATRRFRGEKARVFFGGLAAHAVQPLEFPFCASFGLVLATLGHSVGWPIPRGGSQSIANAMASYLRTLGGKIRTGSRIEALSEIPKSRVVMLDLTPRQALRIAGDILPAGYRSKLERFRYGPGVFKMDWALDGPIPWRAREVSRAGTVHLGGSLEEIAAGERAAWEGRICERPFVLLAQQSLFDSTRAPEGKHTCWAYCHVPHGSSEDMSARIEAQIERFAPGFRDRILARSILAPASLEARNANLVGGDIGGGATDIRQLFARPIASLNPYATPVPGLYLCSSSTPPGGGVHGMCGYLAARAALHNTLR